MRRGLIWLVALSLLPLRAEPPPSPGMSPEQSAKWDQDCKYSEALAVKLYPELSNSNSDMAKATATYHRDVMASGSRLTTFSTWPLILAIYTAAVLEVRPDLQNLTDDDRSFVFGAMQYSLAHTKDFLPQSAAQASVDAATASANSSPSVAAFDCYLSQTITACMDSSHRITSGPYARLSVDAAVSDAKQKWIDLPDDQKAAYQKMADQTGDPGNPSAQEQERETSIHSIP